MKRIALTAAAAIVAMGSAHAQMAMPSASNIYGELGYMWTKIDAIGDTARPGAIRGVLGWDFHPYFAAEFMLAGGVGDATTNASVNGVPTEVTVKMPNMYGLYVKGKYMVDKFELFGRLGYAQTKVQTHSNNNNLLDTNQSDGDFSYGVGVNYHFHPKMYVGLDWMLYSNQSGHKVEGMTLGFGYVF